MGSLPPWLWSTAFAKLPGVHIGRHDDQVDALTQGLAWGRISGRNRIGGRDRGHPVRKFARRTTLSGAYVLARLGEVTR